jgi:hypothetical protein
MINQKEKIQKEEDIKNFRGSIKLNSEFIIIPFPKNITRKTLNEVLNEVVYNGYILNSKDLRKIFKTLNKIGEQLN